MTDTSTVLASTADGVMTITLNRPAARNALNPQMLGELAEALRTAELDPDARVVVLTGAGTGFCSGGDLKELDNPDPGDALAVRHAGDPAWEDMELRTARLIRRAESPRLLSEMGKPTIAMINGPAIGAGLSLALACDFRIAADSVIFGAEFAKIGLSGDFGGLYFLNAILGPLKTTELAMLGARLSAQEALELGLINKAVPADALAETVAALAGTLAAGPPVAYRLMKENLRAARNLDLRGYLEVESRNMVRSVFTKDAREGIAAFKDKRKPEFKGL